MEENSHTLILSRIVSNNAQEQDIPDRLKDLINERNKSGFQKCEVLSKLGIDNITDLITGPDAVAFLLSNGTIVRASYKTRTLLSTNLQSSAISTPSNAPPPASSLVRNPKFRRVMLSTSSFRRADRAGGILDRGRPVLPASAVPEELIAQAQVVLQGKSRELIVRELQRTNLNVNEAVNNLLSRDDDEDDQDDGAGEVVLPEELLSLLDPSSQAILDGEYGESFEYVMSREKKRSEKEKEKKAKETEDSNSTSRLDLDADIQNWNGVDDSLPSGVSKFVKMAATGTELLALSAEGSIFSWGWSTPTGDQEPHSVAHRLIEANDPVVDIAACRLRVVLLTKNNCIATWLDKNVVGDRVCRATEIPSTALQLNGCETVAQICASTQIALARTSTGSFIWCGLFPFGDRPKIWEKDRAKAQSRSKHVKFEDEMKEGAEVKTKSFPIYYAGSVAVNLIAPEPMIGILMESAWSLTEMNRFRLLEPSAYDSDFPNNTFVSTPAKPFPATGENRKRRASQDVFAPSSSVREEAWQIADLIFIHEQQAQEVATVKLVDGQYVGIEYSPVQGDMTYGTSQSGALISSSKDAQLNNAGKIRIFRKDELIVANSKSKCPRTPRIMMREPFRFNISGNSQRRVISAVADSKGIRVLNEKRGRLFITRCSISGKVISDHFLPMFPAAITGQKSPPSLLNYGEDNFLFLKDGYGSLTPLVRDAAMGFREPYPLLMPPLRHSSLYAMAISAMPSSSKSNTSSARKMILFATSAPTSSANLALLPSLLQNILFADKNGVKRLLDKLQDIGDSALIKSEVLDDRSDGGMNILHAAVRLAVAAKNKEDADPSAKSKDDESRSRDRDGLKELEQRWQRLIRSGRGVAADRDDRDREGLGGLATFISVSEQRADRRLETCANANQTASVNANENEAMDADAGKFGCPVDDIKTRQQSAIEIVKILVEHPMITSLLPQLLTHRDFGGLTPFQSAVNIRAYGAALHIWNAIKQLGNGDVAFVQRMIFPVGSRPDDSPLFVLCYNDTCSFTWTGEEHINQDIFECKTCGLTGSLCCCTECALTCHRNHDCKLKRTSPTAYCDCWEKCPCRALVSGNQEKRETLLKELLNHTNLHEMTNNRGEHIMLFLARTLGRQQVEQSNPGRRRRTGGGNTGDNPNVPEHDLEPPKFAKFALETCLSEWNVIKSVVQIGVRHLESLGPVYEDILCLHSQNGSTHLDKFVFTLLVKCSQQCLNQLVDTLIMAANVQDKSRDPVTNDIIDRFVRSIVRIYVLLVLLSPSAAATSVRGKGAQTAAMAPQEKRLQTISLSGFFSMVRNEPPPKDPKSNAQTASSVIMKCRTVLLRLGPFSVLQTVFAADALISPVRFGIVRPIAALTISHNHDCLEVVEKFLNSENDLTTLLAKAEEAKEKSFRRRKNRLDTDREDDDHTRDESDSDFDSEGSNAGMSSRRINSQSGAEETKNATTGIIEYVGESESSSSESESDDDDEGHVIVDNGMLDEDMEEEIVEDDDHDEAYGDVSEGDHETDVTNSYMMGHSESQSNDHDGDAEVQDEEENSHLYDADSSGVPREEEGPFPNDEERLREQVEAGNEPAVEDEENTRDAVHSEASSAEGGDGDDSEEPRDHRNEANLDTELSAVMGRLHPPSARSGPTRPSRRADATSWTLRRSSGRLWETVDANSDRDRDERTGTALRGTALSNAAGGSGSDRRKSKEDHLPTALQTSRQLSAAFAIVVRLVCDLLLRNRDAIDKSSITLNCSAATFQFVTMTAAKRLEVIWNWMSTVLDRTEAQLQFGNSVMLSAAGEAPKSKSRKKDSSTKRDKPAEENASHNTRRDGLEYILSVLRSQSGEAGDDYPIVDVDSIQMLVFVFDAYMTYQDTMVKVKRLGDISTENNTERKDVIEPPRRFFQRSNSMCFPGIATTDGWDTLSKNGSLISLVDRTYLLSTDACPSSLFAPPSLPMSWSKYQELHSTLGSPNVLNMSFADPSTRISSSQESTACQEPMDQSVELAVPEGMEPVTIETMRANIMEIIKNPLNTAISRWKNVIHYIAKECHQDLLIAYGGESGKSHLLTSIAGYARRQAMFHKVMDKFRGLQTKDISFEVHRDPAQLLRDVVYQLNHSFVRRQNAPKSRDDPSLANATPLASTRVKVRFHDEPGEGSGVARSFYTALAEALMSLKKFPFTELGWEGDDYLFGAAGGSTSTPSAPSHPHRERSVGRIALIRDRGTTSAILSRKRATKRYPLQVTAPPYNVEDIAVAEQRLTSGQFKNERTCEDLAREKPVIADCIFMKVRAARPNAAARIAGILVNIPVSTALQILNNSEICKSYIEDAVNLLLSSGAPADLALLSQKDDKLIRDPMCVKHESDEAPLFVRTCRRGLFVPVPGKLSPMRLSVFRNVGRMIGLCLSQNEIFPLKLARHVLKFIVGRPVCWMDLQFFDPQLFESLRQLLSTENDDTYFDAISMRFTTDVPCEDGSEKTQTISLKPDGENIPVTRANVVEYVYLFIKTRMLSSNFVKCLTAMRLGVAEVVPLEALNGLTAEDLRFLMCGTESVCVGVLQSATIFSDESHSPTDVLDRFKQWFWSVVDGLSMVEKQELIFFWTGSPSLPMTAEALQPPPSVVVRPPDDGFLPTANTCISRLYVPLYSSKKLLRSKLQIAIKAKNFGFV